mmetsp:Transcript_131896/g.282051  ORF Transcript_131896/g.282051 Transcript_131896/m.282051 type:complete len:282 (+) Transcript_131896:1077-1922(+)
MSAADERHCLLVAEAHPAEDVANVLGELLPTLHAALAVHLPPVGQVALGPWQAPWGDRKVGRGVHAAASELNPRTASVLDCDIGREDPEVGVGEPGMLCLHRLQEGPGLVEPRILGVASLQGVPHCGAVGAARAIMSGVSARGVPSETDEQRSVAAVVPFGRVHDSNEILAHHVEVRRRVEAPHHGREVQASAACDAADALHECIQPRVRPIPGGVERPQDLPQFLGADGTVTMPVVLSEQCHELLHSDPGFPFAGRGHARARRARPKGAFCFTAGTLAWG